MSGFEYSFVEFLCESDARPIFSWKSDPGPIFWAVGSGFRRPDSGRVLCRLGPDESRNRSSSLDRDRIRIRSDIDCYKKLIAAKGSRKQGSFLVVGPLRERGGGKGRTTKKK